MLKKNKFNGKLFKSNVGQTNIILFKSSKYMNECGYSISQIVNYLTRKKLVLLYRSTTVPSTALNPVWNPYLNHFSLSGSILATLGLIRAYSPTNCEICRELKRWFHRSTVFQEGIRSIVIQIVIMWPSGISVLKFTTLFLGPQQYLRIY